MGMYPTEHTCHICKKEFPVFSNAWVYRRGDNWLCSYHCVVAYEAQKTQRRSKGRLSRADKEKIMEMLEIGVNPQKIADKMGVTVNAIAYYQNKAREIKGESA